MFFRRNEGQYRETDRVTRFKLIKSGKCKRLEGIGQGSTGFVRRRRILVFSRCLEEAWIYRLLLAIR